MIDIDTLLDRLRTAAAEHVSPQLAAEVPVRSWPPATAGAARQAMLDAWAVARGASFERFLATDSGDFVELAFRTYLGRAPDPVGRAHYLGRQQQGVPRLEILAELAGSQESVAYRGRPDWPLWFRPLLRGLRFPAAFGRRVARGVLRRIERRLGARAESGSLGLMWRLAETIDATNRSWQHDFGALSRKVDSGAEAVAGRLARFESELSSRLAATANALAGLQAHLAALDYSFSALSGAAPPAGDPAAADADVVRYYLTLESVFRGDPERIRAQLKTDYLSMLLAAKADAGNGCCIDLGCGRGEWLDVLAAHDFAGTGVDLNPVMAAQARARGHAVTVGDALSFLRAQPGNSALAISAFHLVEHLDFSTLFRLVAECRRVLMPRGLLLLETPNPENLWVATHTFHHDPTHSQPLTPASLEFLVNHHGLETVAVLRLHPYPDDARLPGNDPVTERLNAMTCGAQDFAVVARKTPLAP